LASIHTVAMLCCVTASATRLFRDVPTSSASIRTYVSAETPIGTIFSLDTFLAEAFAHIADDIVRVTAWGIYQNFIDYSKVMLVGASVGGTGVLLALPRLKDTVCAVVTFAAACIETSTNCPSPETPRQSSAVSADITA